MSVVYINKMKLDMRDSDVRISRVVVLNGCEMRAKREPKASDYM